MDLNNQPFFKAHPEQLEDWTKNPTPNAIRAARWFLIRRAFPRTFKLVEWFKYKWCRLHFCIHIEMKQKYRIAPAFWKAIKEK